MFAMTLAVQLKSGGGLAETLQTLGDTVTQRVGLAARAKALAAEVIFSAKALSYAPVIVTGLLYWINPQSVDLLFYDPTGNMLLAYASHLGDYREPGDTLDDQKGYSTMTVGLSLVALAIAAATAAFVLIIREVHIRTLDIRVSKAVIGVPSQSAPFQDMTGWFSSLGERYRRFYAPENLEQLRTILQSSGFNHHRTLPIWIGVKTASMYLFPLIALCVALLLEKPLTDVLIFTLIGVVIGIMGPRLVLSVLRRRFNAAVRLGTPECYRFAGCVQRSGNGPGERAGTSGGRNEADQSCHGPGLIRSS